MWHLSAELEPVWTGLIYHHETDITFYQALVMNIVMKISGLFIGDMQFEEFKNKGR